MLKSVRRYFTYLLVRTLVGLAALLPRSIGSSLFSTLGGLAYAVFRGSRRAALANLELVYGGTHSDREIRDIAKASFTNLGKFAYDTARFRGPALRDLDKIVKVAGEHHLENALAQGRGVVAMTGHVGNWELLGAYYALKGHRINVVATTIRDARLNDMLVGLRRGSELRVLERSRALVGAVRCLKRGEVLGVLIDQDTSVESTVVDFLGHPAKTAVGFVKLAAATGAVLLPMAMLMTEDGGYEVNIREPVDIGGNGCSLEDDVEKCSKAVEQFILEEPTQWVWMHKRWKSVNAEMYA
jgi:KDO2-lipid IV(A) lauroyltransferase